MPSVISVGPYKRIIFDKDDWLSGLNTQYMTGLTDVPAPQYGKGLSEAIRFNPFRNLGYATPGFNPTDLTNVSAVTTNILNIALASESSTNYAYGISSGALLHRIDIANKSISNSGSWPHTTTGAGAVTGSDVVAYTANVGGTATACIFYSWNDAGGSWNVGRFRTDTGAFDDDFMSTVPATPLSPSGNNKPHAMIVGADDVLYILDGNKVHAYDGATGTDGTFSASVQTYPQGYINTSFSLIAQPSPFLVTYGYYSPSGNSVTVNSTSSGPAKAFFWDYLSLDPSYVIDLDDRVVTAGFTWRGTIGCITQGNNLVNDGANRFCRVKVWNGSIFETVATYIGNAPVHGGIDIVGNSVQWNASNGSVCNIFSYGSPYEDVDAGLNILGAGAGNTPGVLRTVGGSIGFQMLSTGTTTSGGLQYMKTGTYAANASARTIAVMPQFPNGQKGKVRAVGIDFAKTSGSTGAQIDAFLVYENSQTSQVIASTAQITTSNITKWYYNDYTDAPLPQFMEISALVRWTAGAVDTDAPVLRRIMIDYEEVPVEQG